MLQKEDKKELKVMAPRGKEQENIEIKALWFKGQMPYMSSTKGKNICNIYLFLENIKTESTHMLFPGMPLFSLLCKIDFFLGLIVLQLY